MEFLVHGRDRPGTLARRLELAEAHWSFMDGYAEALVARGPTLAADLTTPTGSLHIVDVADPEAARLFAYGEPYFRAGVFEEVLVRRWRRTLGRTMWDFAGDGGPRFLVLGHGRAGAAPGVLLTERQRYLGGPAGRGHVILDGSLLSDDGAEWAGSGLLVELPDRAAVEALLAAEPLARAGLYASAEIHDWRFGGRPGSPGR